MGIGVSYAADQFASASITRYNDAPAGVIPQGCIKTILRMQAQLSFPAFRIRAMAGIAVVSKYRANIIVVVGRTAICTRTASGYEYQKQ